MIELGERVPLDGARWRSLLYVPANRPRFIDNAPRCGADALILDLEDSVPVAERERARAGAAAAVAALGAGGADVLVRINALGGELEADLDALSTCLPRALVVPKVESAATLARVSGWLSMRPEASGVGIVVLIESVRGLLDARAIAAADSRNLALALGAEDFATDAGLEPSADTLAVPKQLALYAARDAGLTPLGLLGTVADWRDATALATLAARSRRFGFEGASCVHPDAVPVLNEAFSPGRDDVERAQRIVSAHASGVERGVGSVRVDGRMVDAAVARRARRVLARHRWFAGRERARGD